MGACVPLIVTVPELPKLEPLIVIAPPTGIQNGVTPVMTGGGTMARFIPLLYTPLTFTTTFPLVEPTGTFIEMELLLQQEGVGLHRPAETPLNVTTLNPWVEPKLVPVMVTVPPTAACDKLRLEMMGPVDETVSALEPLMEPDRAVIVDVPAVNVVAKPELLTVATVVEEELQVAELVRFCVLASV